MQKIAFTLVLNGMPYIKRQAEIIPKHFDKWYIVEGACAPVKDTSWCKPIPSRFYDNNFLSVDGTSEFLDSIASDKIKIIRKNSMWNGKLEMCNSFMHEVENAILMEFDVDEIWDTFALGDLLSPEIDGHPMFRQGFSEQSPCAVQFRATCYVGPNLIITSENTYGDMPYEWCRMWIIKKRTEWESHEPPRLKGITRMIPKQYTSKWNFGFYHFAYALRKQVEFKEEFYGYKGAVDAWEKLQKHNIFPCKLKDHLPWVHDNAIVDLASAHNIYSLRHMINLEDI